MTYMGTNIPRRYKARYASSMAGEIQKNVVLAPGEKILYSKLVRERKNWLRTEPRLLAITPRRIILLEHNLFASDWILEIPRAAMMQPPLQENGTRRWVDFAYSDSDATHTLRIQPMRRYVSDEENRELFDVISAFHEGELGRFSEALSTEVR
jgi:hypothetical protein